MNWLLAHGMCSLQVSELQAQLDPGVQCLSPPLGSVVLFSSFILKHVPAHSKVDATALDYNLSGFN